MGKLFNSRSLAALAPPNQKTKARYMNVDVLVEWGQALLAFLDRPSPKDNPMFDSEQVEQKLGWITDYRSHLEAWGEMFHIIATTESFVRQQGLYHGAQGS